MSRQEAVLTYGSSRISFSIVRTRRQTTIAVTVRPTGAVAVRAPKGTRKRRIEQLIVSKAGWILEQQESFREQHANCPRSFISGESLYYPGRQYLLRVRRSRSNRIAPSISMHAGCFNVTLPTSADRGDAVRGLIVDWYRDRAAFFLPQASHRYAECIGIDLPKVRIRQMSARWGSCGKAGWVAYNWRIIMAPKRLLEYVAAHEVCHLVRSDHSKAFWRTLESLMHDYELRRVELAITGAKYDV